MSISVKIVAVCAAIIAGVGMVSALYAHETGKPGEHGGSMMGQGMMGKDGTMGMTGPQMMDHCSQMMQGTMGSNGKPNEYWRRDAPKTPQQGG